MGRLRGLAAAAALSVLAGCASGRKPMDRIVLITIDTLRWDHLGYVGYDVATPNLDRLAACGTVFREAVAAAPITLPSHCSIMTGLYPPEHGVRNNGTFRLSGDVQTVAESLHEAGFATGAFIGAFVLDRRFGLQQGFDHYDDNLPEENPLHSVYYAERPAEQVVSAALAWIRAHEAERFFVWVHVYDPHRPFTAPAPYSERYPGRPYDAEIAYTDAALGPLIDAVSGIAGGEGTAIIVTGDHGESLGEHRETTHTIFIYDATMRVPLLLKGPGLPAGASVDRQVRTVDIAPTILELAGLQAKAALDGVSLLRYLGKQRAPERTAYGETFAPRFDFNWSELRFLRKGGLKLIDAPRPELYDLKSDPKELNNLWSETPPEVGQRLLSELRHIEEADDETFGSSVELDEDTARRLESLGYVARPTAAARRAGPRPDPKDRIQVHEQMQRLLGSELPAKEIIQAYRDILAEEPTNVLARHRLASKLSEEGRLEEAVVEYRKLIEASEIGAKGLENLGVALLLLGRTDEALKVTERAVREMPWNLDLQVLRGEALEKASRLEEALEAYQRAIDLRPEASDNHWRHGAVALQQGDKEQAERDFREAIARDGSFAPALAALGRLLSEEGRQDEAIRLLSPASSNGDQKALHTPEIKAALAQAYVASARYDEARSLLEEAKAQDPENTRVLALLGSLYGRSGELDEAEETLRKALALGETDPEIRRNLALVYTQQGRIAPAIRELQRASEDAPGDATIWYSLGNAFLQAKRPSAAAAAFGKALELRPRWPAAAFNRALALDKAGRPAKAAEAYRRFLATGASDPRRRALAEKRLALLKGRGKR